MNNLIKKYEHISLEDKDKFIHEKFTFVIKDNLGKSKFKSKEENILTVNSMYDLGLKIDKINHKEKIKFYHCPFFGWNVVENFYEYNNLINKIINQ